MPISQSEIIALDIARLTVDEQEQKKLIDSYYHFMKEADGEFTSEAILELIKLYKPLSKADRSNVAKKFTFLVSQVNQSHDEILQSNEDEDV
jgi:hypothetical protein